MKFVLKPVAVALAAMTLIAADQPGQIMSKQAQQGSGIDVSFEGLRNTRGTLRLCLSRNPAHYPDCSGDSQARKISIPATTARYRFDNVPQGTYALTAIHDANSNGELDTVLGIPREGFAFSNNPRIRFGPPSYEQVRFTVGPQRASLRLEFKYVV